MFLALSTFLLFILLMKSVNEVKILNIDFFSFASFADADVAAMFTTDIVPLETIYISLKSHKLDIVVFNLIWLLVVYVPHASSFISTQFFILILDCWCGPLYSKFVIFSIFHYYIIILILVPQLFAVFLQVIFISSFLFLWIFFLIGN